MRYQELKDKLKDFVVFTLNDIRKTTPDFHRRRLNEWQDKGYIKKLRRGFYMFSDLSLNEQSMYLIANKLYAPSYISMEAALSYYGLIPEGVYTMTSISTKKTSKFMTPIAQFSYRSIKPSLFFGYKLEKYMGQSYKIAEIEKVLLDYVYFNPKMADELDFQGWRFNSEDFLEKANMAKLRKYTNKMLTLTEIEQQYPPHLHKFKKGILREYLQYKILEIIFASEYARKLVFLGGTALRIIYGNTRFSEDLDFDNFDLSDTEFEGLSQKVRAGLEAEGLKVQIDILGKTAYRCRVRLPEILFINELSPYQEEKILIQIDSQAQGFEYAPDKKILNKFDVFKEIFVTPLDILLSQKIYAALNRKRAKGRDFYDVVYLCAMTKPNYAYLKLKMGVTDAQMLRMKIIEEIKGLDFKELGQEVITFLFNPNDTRKIELFPEFIAQAPLE